MVAISSLLYLVRLRSGHARRGGPPAHARWFALPRRRCQAPCLGPLRRLVSAGFVEARALKRPRQPAAQLVSYTYAIHGWWRCCALFVVVTVCSLLADSVMPQSKLVTSADRVFATAGTIVSPVSARTKSRRKASVVPLGAGQRSPDADSTRAGSRAADAWPDMLGHAALGAVCAGDRALQSCVLARFARYGSLCEEAHGLACRFRCRPHLAGARGCNRSPAPTAFCRPVSPPMSGDRDAGR